MNQSRRRAEGGLHPTLSALLNETSAYHITSNQCGVLAPAAQCQISLAFSPAAVGLATATLTLSEPTQGNVEIPLWGHGIEQAAAAVADIRFTRTVTTSWNMGYCQNLVISNQPKRSS
jgi:hypothetical protein